MRKTLSAAVLIMALCCPVSAGIMHNPAPVPGPTPASTVQEPTDGVTLNGEIPTPGIMHTPGIIHTPGVAGSLAQFGLDLLAVLPSIL